MLMLTSYHTYFYTKNKNRIPKVDKTSSINNITKELKQKKRELPTNTETHHRQNGGFNTNGLSHCGKKPSEFYALSE